ncbi:uncharacterized protein, partial [Cherax quadricarinatus]|uniref:uncharacterized protein n=1 Tax=Cherax quadricarinatus TaxID=27406 RepID=UPI00387EB05C
MYKGKTDRLFNFLTKSNVQNHSEQSDWQEGRKKSESRRVGSFKVGREETRKREPLNSVKWESGLENKINIKKENEFDLEKKNISNWRKGSESVYSVDLENTNKGQRTGCSIGPIRAKPSYRLPRSPGTEVVKSRIGNTPLQPNKPLEHPSELNKVSNNTNRLIQNPITSETVIWDDKNRTESKTFATARKLMGKNDDFKTNDVFKGSEKDELDMVPEHKHWNEDDHTQYLTLVMPFGEPVDVVVTWILSPVKFYCQVNSSFTQTWKEKMEAAQVHYNSLLPEKGSSTFAKNQMVMALDTEGQWHRAKVLCVSGNNINVQFIDIGTIETANQMFPMKKEYVENIPAMAICIVIPDLKP